MDPMEDPLRFSVSVPMVSLEEPLDSSAELVAAKPLDDGASFIKMRLLGLSVFGFADPLPLSPVKAAVLVALLLLLFQRIFRNFQVEQRDFSKKVLEHSQCGTHKTH
jgi:hypothetical protein